MQAGIHPRHGTVSGTKRVSDLVVGDNTLSYGRVVEVHDGWVRFDSNAVVPLRDDLLLTLVG